MKRIYLYTVSACLLLLSACSSDNDELPGVGNNNTPSAALHIEVSASDFTHAGDANTRATDKGKETTFENNDRIGITALDESGNILYDNIPYKYNNSEDTWEFDNNNGEGKTALYYDKQATTYLAYFPYSEKANGATGIGELKELFPPLPDQRSKDAYRASDLLLGEGKLSDGSPSDDLPKTLNIAFTHAYSSLSFPSSVEVTCTIADGENCPYSALVRDVSFTIDGELLLPYLVSDSTYRIVVSPGETSVGCLFGVGGGRMYSNTTSLKEWVGNILYTLTLPSDKPLDIGEYGLEMARLGDFYCKKNESEEGYLIPGNAPTDIITAHKNDCLGIVYWVGSEAYDDDPLLKGKHSDCNHGLAIALHDAGSGDMYWSTSYEEITTEWVNKDGNPYKDKVNLQAADKWCGYSNTLALMDYNAGMYDSKVSTNNNYRVLPIDAIQEFSARQPAPVNSSGWYFPSVMELKYVCWGQGNDGNTKGKNMLDIQLKKLGEEAFGSGTYWSGTDSGSGFAWFVGFGSGGVVLGVRNTNTCLVRPLLAF